MQPEELKTWAKRLTDGTAAAGEFAAAYEATRSAELTQSTLDLDRLQRCGYSEVVFGQGKSIAALLEIFEEFAARQIDGFATRIDGDQSAALLQRFSNGRYNRLARTFRLPVDDRQPAESRGGVAVVTAGTSDAPVAEEARETAAWMGASTSLFVDVGVAGPHRLQQRLPEIRQADCVVVVAGMEGALPSVVGGHVAVPVIAVPTSVGYGASFGGVAALLGMLNSCAANVAVVNIDAGFKAGYLAAMIAAQTYQHQVAEND
ncbi:MAG: nickel pincer cofactor biosynthesis protein LarB [Pirellulales bacterium]